MPYLKPEMRELVQWAEQHGWHLEDKLDGRGHYVLRYKTGEYVTLSSTPGEYRGTANVRARIRRIAGLPSDSGPAARYRHEGKRRSRFNLDVAIAERDARRKVEAEAAESAEAEREALKSRLRELTDELASIEEAGELRKRMKHTMGIARECVEIKAQLKRLGEPGE